MKKLLTIALALVLVASVAAASAAELVIGASSTPHAEILEAAKDLLAAKDITLDVIVFDDYVQPNLQLDAGDLDANYFQHVPYLESFCADNGTKLVSAGAVHYEPMGIYSNLKKAYTVDTIPEKAVIAVPNDPTNEARALNLLAALGLITLSNDAGTDATVLDIDQNPKNIEVQEFEAAAVPRMLADVDLAIINSNYALQAGVEVVGTAIATESSDIAYPNIIAVREGDERAELKTLVEVLQSEEMVQWIKDTYGTSVVPTK
jgi:D-methionine transport system substrate-binding protein